MLEYDNIINNVKRHIDLNTDEISFFVSLISKKLIRKKDFLLKENQVCKAVTFVNKGCLKSYFLNDAGIHIIQFAGESWWIGDLKSYVQGTPAQLYIDAIESTEVFQITKPKMEELYTRIPQFERFFRMQIENALINHQDRILQSQVLKTKGRYENFKKAYPFFYKRIPLKDVANYLGVTPEHLSAIRAK